MAKQRKSTNIPAAPVVSVPRGTLARIDIGRSFAEYDRLLAKPNIFVETPATHAALDASKTKCFFVGRRGTGKTALTLHVQSRFPKTTITLLPQIFSQLGRFFQVKDVEDIGQRHFKSLVACFKRALADEVVRHWVKSGHFSFQRSAGALARERNNIEDLSFDGRLIALTEGIFSALETENDREWLRQINRIKDLINEMNDFREDDRWDCTILIDRIDESWDGSDKAVALLAALMHACVELTASSECIRPLLFVRENIFDRVRESDREFARLETFVVSLDWSRELLLELIERRLNASLTSKLPLRGPTWDTFCESVEGESSRDMVFDYCQYRPRDVLTYCSLAIESAQHHRRQKVLIEDFQAAKMRFSENRLKDLGDEYTENYPRVQLVFSRFFGLGREFTIAGIDSFIKKLLVDHEVKESCKSWIFRFTQPDLFIYLLYELGFFGIRCDGMVQFRSSGAEGSRAPAITSATLVVIHPSFTEALSLQNVVIGTLDPSTVLRTEGLVLDLPNSINLSRYTEELITLRENLQTLPKGQASSSDYERLIGEMIRLCFFRYLTNLESKARSHDGRVIRDWIASNTAGAGFWEMVRQRYGATQVVWECKNYDTLGADDFHQAAYYMTREIGRFGIICFRGEPETRKHYLDHLKRIASDKDGVVLLLGERDVMVFIRQAINLKSREEHIRDIYDQTVRAIS